MFKYFRLVSTVLFFFVCYVCYGHEKNTKLNESDLKIKIETIVKDYPGLRAGIALIGKDGTDWMAEFGSTDTDNTPSTSLNTMFRIGSISKMFVAISILQLRETGKLSLTDKVRDIAPEVEFDNFWEEAHPVRIVHLLEHTTGWDELHLAERVHNDPSAVSLKTVLDFHPHSRKSRWIPGSRMSYCNSGYAVAAYLVEKITGLSFEQYVQKEVLLPLGMTHTTFFDDSLYNRSKAETYNWALEKVNYKHELYRPSGAMNASVKDMAQLLKIFVNKGRLDSMQFLSRESIQRMETPKSTPGAIAGLQLGYGLGNMTTVYNALTYHGHDGAIDGGLSQLAYLPEQETGHLILLNANNAEAMQRIAESVRLFEQQQFDTVVSPKPSYHGEIDIKEGFYLAINPRNQSLYYQDVLFAGIEKIKIRGNSVLRSWILPGPASVYHPVSSRQFTLGATGKIGLVKATDPLAGEVLYTENYVLEKISDLRVYVQIGLFVLWIALMLSGGFIFLTTGILYVFERAKYRDILRTLTLPILSSLLIAATFGLTYSGMPDSDLLFSKPTLISIAALTTSILFVAVTLLSVIVSLFRQYSTNKIIRYLSVILSLLHLSASVYLIYYGFIPLITWA